MAVDAQLPRAAAVGAGARPRRVAPWIGLGAWVLIVVASRLAGLLTVHRDPRAALAFPPLAARWMPRLPPIAVLAIVVGALLVWALPRAGRLSWRGLLTAAFLSVAVWSVALAAVDGVQGLTGDANYLADVPRIARPGVFLAGFVRSIATYSQHVRAHPPGYVLVLWALRRVGLGGPGWEAVLVVLVGSAMVPAALIATREVAGEVRARMAAPFLVLSPIVLWLAVSADAVAMGVSSIAIALVVLATGRRGGRSDALAVGGGVAFGAALLLSYGLSALALVPVAVAVRRRRIRVLVLAGLGALALLGLFRAAGFDWLAGLRASIVQYRIGVARFRPQSTFWLIDVGAFALALGPAAGAGLAGLRDRPTWVLVGAALVAVALADASGLSKAEVERIWLPFAPWILLACSSLMDPDDRFRGRGWVALQVAACLALQLTIRGP